MSNVTDNIDTVIERRMVRFIFNSINQSNSTCKNVLRVKLLSVNSTFAANYQFLSYKYGLIEADWFTPLDHLLGKVKQKVIYKKVITSTTSIMWCPQEALWYT